MQTVPEYELKFEIEPRQVTRLLHAPWLRDIIAGKPSKRHLRAVYYDTPNGDLRRQAVSFRVRRSGRQHIQCVKSMPGEPHKCVARDEFEIPIPDALPHPEMIPDEHLPFKRALCEQLQPVFETDIQRTIRILRPDEQTELELAVDKGRVCCEEREDSFCEVEVELRRGCPTALFDVGRRIVREVPARLGVLFKADRGYQLSAPSEEPWVKSAGVILSEDMTAEEALITLFLAVLRQVRLNEEYAIQTGAPEAVHQLRVGLRRLRSVLQVYKKVLPERDYRRFNRGLKWITDRGGAVRDWDVFMDQRLGPVQTRFHDMDSLQTLREHAESQRSRAQASLTRALRSTRYARLLIDVGEWIHERQWREQPVTEDSAALFSPVREFASARLEERYHKLCKKGAHFAELSEHKRHRMRIALKKLRYASEFFGSLYKKKDVERFVKRLKALQETLGSLNDIANLPAMSEALLGKPSPNQDKEALSYASGLLAGWHSCEVNRLVAEAGRQWKKLEKTPGFWN